MRSRVYNRLRTIGLSSFAAGDRRSFSQAASARASTASRSTRPSELEDGATIVTPYKAEAHLGPTALPWVHQQRGSLPRCADDEPAYCAGAAGAGVAGAGVAGVGAVAA